MIKFFYFDVGGVAVKDFSGTNKWNGMKNIMGVEREFEKAFDDLYDEYELNELCLSRDVDTLIPIFTKRFKMHFPPNFSILKYFVDHFERNLSLWPVIERVRETCRIGLLTNMYLGMLDEIQKKELLPPFSWNVIIDSSKVGLQKPDPRIFDLAQQKSGVDSPEILFVDNNQSNTDAARKSGWQTFFYDSSNHEESCQKLSEFISTIGFAPNPHSE